VSPFWSLLRGVRAAVNVRRKMKGPLRPTWDPTFEALAEFFHQGSRRITRLPLEAQRRTTTSVLLGLPESPLYQETRFEKLQVAGTPAEWFRREDAAQGPVILYLHGGGFGLGSIETHRDLVARICRAARASALVLDYRLAPEHKFPAQLEDALCAYQWLLDEHIDPRRLVIAGDSAGGGLTLSTLLKLRDVGHPLPACAVALSPWVDLEQTGSTLDANERFDYISRRALNQYARRFIDPTQLKNPLAASLHADLSGLPPLLIQVGSAEVLLDDSRRVAERAKAAGVDVTLRVWEDMIHVWHLFAFMAPQGVAAIEEIGAFIREHVVAPRISESLRP
jgi:monoterpene epsilon-lactone hydrolase